ncbi:CPBP family intramembrane metalloprotease [Halogeometricum sp. S1BR25-6]|uniref:CPBP family intramembrane metalloprotease n=1 Tax=Halogeometricum salsisoli TaxID=2950536 RepID=A0ABU2GKU8_9EURY|nr:CPBP family intramembrane glutamic endopeptidase [Halogeometricum sp. S1BR25-6]MDS0301435.1 CPBP family intramembrane metalloprotease [Halogeometricum sp. S1BR25-6]
MKDIASRVKHLLLAIALAAAGFLLGLVLLSFGTAFFEMSGVRLTERPAIRLVVSTVLLQGVAFGTVALWYVAFRSRGSELLHVRFPSRRDITWIIGGGLLFAGVYFGLTGFVTAVGLPIAQNNVAIIASETPSVVLLLVPLSILFVGPGEELLFRGIVQGLLTESFAARSAIVLASAIFAISHAGSLTGRGQLTYMIVVFGLAVVLGTLYELSGNLVVPALLHGGYNAVLYANLYLSSA